MELMQIKEFVCIADYHSFSAASKKLYISQPTLSKHMQLLEKELGAPLLERTTRNVQLTDFGASLLSACRSIVDQTTFITNTAKKHADRQKTLTIASIPLITPYHITEIAAQFMSKHPRCRIAFDEKEFEDFIPDFMKGNYPLAFFRDYGVFSSKFDILPIASDTLVVVLPSSHPLVGRQSIQVQQLAKEPIIAYPKGSSVASYIESKFKAENIEPNIIEYTERMYTMIDLVSNKFGIALMFADEAEYFRNANVVIRTLSPVENKSICLFRRKGANLSDEAQMFWNFIRSYTAKSSAKTACE